LTAKKNSTASTRIRVKATGRHVVTGEDAGHALGPVFKEIAMTDDVIRWGVEKLLATWAGWPTLKTIINETSELHVYLAGGVLRDILLRDNRPVKDFDFIVGGPGLARCLERLAQVGCLAYGPLGSPRWFPPAHAAPYADLIPIDKFRSGLWLCENIVDVLNQFDCTVNAVAIDLRTGAIYDPQNGRRDAVRRVMRAVRFDYCTAERIHSRAGLNYAVIQWHRYVQYASILKLKIEPITMCWLRANRPSEADSRRYADAFSVPVLDACDTGETVADEK
jgi:hypothetical protein